MKKNKTYSKMLKDIKEIIKEMDTIFDGVSSIADATKHYTSENMSLNLDFNHITIKIYKKEERKNEEK